MSWRASIGLVALLLFATAPPSHGQESEAETPAPTSFEVVTRPPGARVFVNWQFKGNSPLRLEALEPGDLLVVTKEDHQARYREVETPRSFYFRLEPNEAPDQRRLLIQINGAGGPEMKAQLLPELVDRGFFIFSEEDISFLEDQIIESDDGAREALLAWIQAYYRSYLWLVIQLPGAELEEDSSRLLVPEDLTSLVDGIADPAGAAYFRLLDLRNGQVFLQQVIKAKGLLSRSPKTRDATRKAAGQEIARVVAEQVIGKSPTELDLEDITVAGPG